MNKNLCFDNARQHKGAGAQEGGFGGPPNPTFLKWLGWPQNSEPSIMTVQPSEKTQKEPQLEWLPGLDSKEKLWATVLLVAYAIALLWRAIHNL